MKRVLYFTRYQMVAQEWSGNKLESGVYFKSDEQGLDLFSAYLRSFQNEPVRLLVDLVEEEFWPIKIPLLRGSDRKSVVKRNYTKYFRNSKYRVAISQAIENKKRKEEKLLLTGLTNENLLEPWLNIIEETRTPLSGIISLPLLSEDYAKSLKSESKAVILVSQQVPSNLRQSVFFDGKLILSRLVPIASFYQGEYANDLVLDIESTQRHLISQRIVERSEVIDVHVLSSKRHLEKLIIRCAETVAFNFKILDINELLKNQKIQIPEEQNFSSGLFCHLATKKTMLNHYAQPKEKKYYQHHLVSLALRFCSVALFAGGFALAMSSGIKGWLYNRTTIDTDLIEKKYSAKYNQLSGNQIESSLSANSMQHIVQTVDEIKQKYLNNPEKMLSLVSHDISIFSDLRVKKIDWFVSNYADTKDAGAVTWGNQTNLKSKVSNSKIPHTKGLFEIAVVEAEFLNFDGNYRYALNAVDDLEKVMSESGKYAYVEILKRPLDIEPQNRLTGNVGKNRVHSNPMALLAFRIVREVANGK
jgi:hypothetical protein